MDLGLHKRLTNALDLVVRKHVYKLTFHEAVSGNGIQIQYLYNPTRTYQFTHTDLHRSISALGTTTSSPFSKKRRKRE